MERVIIIMAGPKSFIILLRSKRGWEGGLSEHIFHVYASAFVRFSSHLVFSLNRTLLSIPLTLSVIQNVLPAKPAHTNALVLSLPFKN